MVSCGVFKEISIDTSRRELAYISLSWRRNITRVDGRSVCPPPLARCRDSRWRDAAMPRPRASLRQPTGNRERRASSAGTQLGSWAFLSLLLRPTYLRFASVRIVCSEGISGGTERSQTDKNKNKKRGQGVGEVVNGPHHFSLKGSDFSFSRPRKNS